MSLNLNLESAVKKLEAGCIKGNCIDGQGTLITPKKDKYIGQWKDSKPYGQGVYTFINGDKYVGYSKNGKIHGQGVYTFKDGAEYKGEFKDGRYSGQGTYIYPHGEKYIGEWKEGKYHGQGTLIFPSGLKREGKFENGKFIFKNQIKQKKTTSQKKITKKKIKIKTKKEEKIKYKSKKIAKHSHSELRLIDQFKDYEKNCTPVESKVKMKTVECIKISDVIDFGKYKEIKIFPQGMLTRKLNSLMLSKKAGQEVYKAFVQRGPRYQTKYPGTMILGMSWYEIFYLGELKKNKKIINRFLEFGPDNYIKYKNKFDPIGSAIAKNKPKYLFNQDVKKLNKLITTNKGRIKMREALGFTKDDFVEEVIKGEWLLGTFLNNDKLKVKKVVLSSDLQKRKVLLARYKSAIGAYKKKLKEKID